MDGLYIFDCTPLLDGDTLTRVLPTLDATRQSRVQRLQTAEKKAQCAAAGVLLSRLFGKDGNPPRLFHGSRGKPYLYGEDNRFFSLSHSGRWVVCATATAEIGVDIQTVAAHNPKIATRCFTQAEQEWLAADPCRRFPPLWTAKEAYLKYTGFGMVLPMSSFTVPCPADGWDDTNHCFWRSFDLDDRHITVCCGQVWDATLQEITL